jgi:L-ascorbate 6-phosphate lactonase
MIDSDLNITWLGQGGFLFDDGDVRLVIDPYLTDSLEPMGFGRMVPPPALPSELAADIICCTHDHGDHFDSGTIIPMMSLSPGCILLGPESVISHASWLGLDKKRMFLVQAGIPIEKKGLTITPVTAFHSDPFAIGYTFECGGVKLYISGDTLYDIRLAPDILDALGGSPDIAVVCINGKLNNMCISEAANLVKQLSPKAAIPMHYGLFASNTADPAPFIQKIESLGINGVLMETGQTKPVSEMI